MKERKISLSKRLMAIVLCVCMMAVSFGTVVFATEGTTTDDVLFSFNADEWVENGATLDTPFTFAELSTYSGGAVTSTGTISSFSVNTDGSFTFSKAADAGQGTSIYIPFKEAINYDTIDGKVVIKMKVDKNMVALADGETAAGYTEQKFGFYSESEGTKTTANTVLFNENSKLHRISSTSGQQNTSLNDTDIDATNGNNDGYYDMRLELEKGYDDTLGPYWKSTVYSDEVGGSNYGNEIWWLKCPRADKYVKGSIQVTMPETINGLTVILYGSQAAWPVYNTSLIFKTLDIYIDKFEVERCSSDVYFDGGNVNVNFDREIDTETAQNITFTDANGISYKSGDVTVNGSVATISTSVLKSGRTYTVSVPDTVKSANLETLSAGKTFTVTATNMMYSLDPNDIVANGATANEDFASSNLSTYTGGQMNSVSTGADYVANIDKNGTETDSFTIRRDYTNAATYTYIPFEKPVNWETISGKVVTEIRLNKNMATLKDETITGSNYTQHLFGYYYDNGSTKSYGQAALFQTNGKLFRIGSTASQQNTSLGETDFDATGGNNDGYYDFKLVLEKGQDETLGKYWKTTLVNNEVGGTNYGKEIWWLKQPREKGTQITQILPETVTGLYITLTANGNGIKQYTSHLEFEKLDMYFDEFEAVNCSSKVYYDEGSINVVFDRDIDAETAQNITFTDANGVSYKNGDITVSGSIATIATTGLTAGQSYTVTVPNTVKSANLESVVPATFIVKASNVMYTLDPNDIVANGATSNVPFTYSNLSSYTGGAMNSTSTIGEYVANIDKDEAGTDTFTYRRIYAKGANTTTYIPFVKPVNWNTTTGKVVVDMKLSTTMSLVGNQNIIDNPTGTSGVYTQQFLGFYGETNGTKTHAYTAYFNTSGVLNQVGSTGSQNSGNVSKNFDTTAQGGNNNGYYEFKIELEKYNDATLGECWKSSIISAEEGGSNYGNTIWSIRLPRAKSSGVNQILPEDVNGFFLNLQSNGDGNNAYTSWVEFEKLDMYFEEFKAESCNTEVYYAGGTAMVEFSDDVDATAVQNITVTDELGENYVDTVTVLNGNVAMVNLKSLTEGSRYTVTVPSTVTSAAGVAVDETLFEVVASKVLLDYDFTNLEDEVGTIYNSSEFSDIMPLIGALSTNNGGGQIAIVQDGYLKFTHTPNNDDGTTNRGVTNEMMTISLPRGVTKGTYAAEFVLKNVEQVSATNKGNSAKYMSIGSSNIENTAYVNYSTGVIARKSTGTFSKAEGSSMMNVNLKEENSDFRLKIVISRTSETEPWTFGIYDMNDETTYPVAFATAETSTVPDDLTSLNFEIYRESAARQDADIELSFGIKSLKVYEEVSTAAAWGCYNIAPTYTIENNVVTWSGRIYGRVDANGNYPKVILAAYDEDGNLLGIDIQDAAPSIEISSEEIKFVDKILKVDLSSKTDVTVKNAKLMILDNYDNITPLVDAVDATIATE